MIHARADQMMDLLQLVVLSLLFPTILTVILFTLGSSHSRRSTGAPNVPRGNMISWPLIGETLAFLKPYPSTSRGDFILGHVSRFGNVFMSNLFGQPTVVSADAQLNRFIFQNDAKVFVPGWPRSMLKMLGKHSILNLTGDEHRYTRSIFLTFLGSARLQTVLLRCVDMSSTAFLSSWKGKTVVSAIAEAKKFTFGTIAKSTLGMAPEDPQTEKLEREFETMSKGMMSLPLNFPGTARWNALKSRSHILNVIKQEREERINKMVRVDDGSTGAEDEDLLAWTLKHTNFTEEQTGDFLLGFLLGGHDTTSKAIALAIYFLDGCPKALEQLQEEHDVIAKKEGAEKEKPELSWDDYKQMEFTFCVFYETLRLGNVAKYVQRKAIKDAQFKEHVIPQGCNVMAFSSSVHLDPSLFEDPEQFNPWRWKDSSGGIKKTQNFMAFGGGSRLCPGAEFAKLEFVVFLHHLVLNYRWELVEPDHPLTCPHVEFPRGLHIKIHTL